MPKSFTTVIDGPFGGRRPTSHERMTGQPWDASYSHGTPPWDIGRPQPAIARLASRGVLAGSVLDAGCGTGEHTLLIASLGLPVLGVDVAETALTLARKKAVERQIQAEFLTADALHLETLARSFETVLDCGLFHTFADNERLQYVASLACVTKRNGTLHVLCFSDEGSDLGPHPVSREELKAAFKPDSGWNITDMESERIETTFHANGIPAWLVTVQRLELPVDPGLRIGE